MKKPPETDTVLFISQTLQAERALKFSINDEELLSDGIEQGDIVRYMTIGGSVCYLEKLYALRTESLTRTHVRLSGTRTAR